MSLSASPVAGLVVEIGRVLDGIACEGSAEVRAGLAGHGQGEPRPVEGRRLPVLRHLPRALAAMPDRRLAAAIAAADHLLPWVAYDVYGEALIGPAFAAGHAFVSLVGRGAPYEAPDFDLGLLLVGPRIFYRDRRHAAPELYLPLTGPHGWRFRPGDPLHWQPAHQPVWNPPWQPHATLTRETPFLALYCWTRHANDDAEVIASDDWPLLEPTA